MLWALVTGKICSVKTKQILEWKLIEHIPQPRPLIAKYCYYETNVYLVNHTKYCELSWPTLNPNSNSALPPTLMLCATKIQWFFRGHCATFSPIFFLKLGWKFLHDPANNKLKNARRRRKHCALGVVRRSQKFRPAADPLPGGARWP